MKFRIYNLVTLFRKSENSAKPDILMHYYAFPRVANIIGLFNVIYTFYIKTIKTKKISGEMEYGKRSEPKEKLGKHSLFN